MTDKNTRSAVAGTAINVTFDQPFGFQPGGVTVGNNATTAGSAAVGTILERAKVREAQRAMIAKMGFTIQSQHVGSGAEGWWALLPGHTEFIDQSDTTGYQSYLGFFSNEADLLDEVSGIAEELRAEQIKAEYRATGCQNQEAVVAITKFDGNGFEIMTDGNPTKGDVVVSADIGSTPDLHVSRLAFIQEWSDAVVSNALTKLLVTLMKDHAKLLAEKFLNGLQSDFSDPQQYALMCLENLVEADPRICHSHDYLDANMTMLRAVSEVIGVEQDDVDLRNVHVLGLLNSAWDAAKSDMRRSARVKLLEVFKAANQLKTPVSDITWRGAVLAEESKMFGAGLLESDAMKFVDGLKARVFENSKSQFVMGAVEGYLASKADHGDTAAHNLRNLVVATLRADSDGRKDPVTIIMVDAFLERESQGGDELPINLRTMLRNMIDEATSRPQSRLKQIAKEAWKDAGLHRVPMASKSRDDGPSP